MARKDWRNGGSGGRTGDEDDLVEAVALAAGIGGQGPGHDNLAGCAGGRLDGGIGAQRKVGAGLNRAGRLVEARLDDARMGLEDQVAAVAVGSVASVRVADNTIGDVGGGGHQGHGLAVCGELGEFALALVGAGGAGRPVAAQHGSLLDNHVI